MCSLRLTNPHVPAELSFLSLDTTQDFPMEQDMDLDWRVAAQRESQWLVHWPRAAPLRSRLTLPMSAGSSGAMLYIGVEARMGGTSTSGVMRYIEDMVVLIGAERTKESEFELRKKVMENAEILSDSGPQSHRFLRDCLCVVDGLYYWERNGSRAARIRCALSKTTVCAFFMRRIRNRHTDL